MAALNVECSTSHLRYIFSSCFKYLALHRGRDVWLDKLMQAVQMHIFASAVCSPTSFSGNAHVAALFHISIRYLDCSPKKNLGMFCRVWSLDDDTLGCPTAVLKGHTGYVTYLCFNKILPNVLASASFDGTCRVWHARDTSVPPIELHPGPSFLRGSRLGTSRTSQA